MFSEFRAEIHLGSSPHYFVSPLLLSVVSGTYPTVIHEYTHEGMECDFDKIKAECILLVSIEKEDKKNNIEDHVRKESIFFSSGARCARAGFSFI
jgi:hypothetical protein